VGMVDKFGVEGWTGVVVELVVAFSLATTSIGRRLRCITLLTMMFLGYALPVVESLPISLY